MNPENIDRKITEITKKIKKLESDHEALDHQNTELHKCDIIYPKN